VVQGSVSGWAGYGFTGMFPLAILGLRSELVLAMTIFVGSMMLVTTGLSVVCLGLKSYYKKRASL
jgi:hypothetical protein